MGNSCLACRLEEVFSQARIAITGSQKQMQARTVTPEVAATDLVLRLSRQNRSHFRVVCARIATIDGSRLVMKDRVVQV
jgi:hypothetical protein